MGGQPNDHAAFALALAAVRSPIESSVVDRRLAIAPRPTSSFCPASISILQRITSPCHSTLAMAKRKQAPSEDDVASKRSSDGSQPFSPPIATASPSSSPSLTALVHSASSGPHNASSAWAHLPFELLSLVASYRSFRILLRLARMYRGFSQQVLLWPSGATGRHSVWPRYSTLAFKVHERFSSIDSAMLSRQLRVGDDRFRCTRRTPEHIATLLSVCRHVSSLRLEYRQLGGSEMYPISPLAPASLFSALKHFTQLCSLAIRCAHAVAVVELAEALDALPLLKRLELRLELPSCQFKWERRLDTTLQRLLTVQLDSAVLMEDQLYAVTRLPPLVSSAHSTPPLRSLHVVPSVLSVTRKARHIPRPHCASLFSSLLHLVVHDCMYLKPVTSVQLPPLLSVTLVSKSATDLSHVRARALCFRCEPQPGRAAYRAHLQHMLSRAPICQQLSISDGTFERDDTNSAVRIFPKLPAESSRLKSCAYLDFVRGLTMTDLTCLVDSTSPPSFAPTLTHLALAIHWKDRAAAAAVLPRLPALYPALTHVHIGVEGKRNRGRLAQCAEWDAVVRVVRTELGAAWCDAVNDVLSHREDVAWRRSVGLGTEW